MKIPVGISNRHIHLSKEVFEQLFGSDYKLEVRRKLNQGKDFASQSTLTLKTKDGMIENVRVIGPAREYTQVEILKSDEKVLNIKAPLRDSGDLKNSASLIIVGPLGEVELDNVCIIANRHIHMNEKDALEFNLKTGDIVTIQKSSTKIENVYIKIKPEYSLECHLDKDDELKYDIHTKDEVEIINE